MADKSFTGLQLPNIGSGQARIADNGFVRLYFKNNNLQAVLADNSDVQLSGRIATTSTLGEVRADGTTITVNGNGVLTAVGSGAGTLDEVTTLGNSTTNPITVGGATVIGPFTAYKSDADSDAIAIGRLTGNTNQGKWAIAIGLQAGESDQAERGVAIGYGAGNASQGLSATAIGSLSGAFNQGIYAVSIGHNSGYQDQITQGTSIGAFSGSLSQQKNSVAVGYAAGYQFQDSSSIAIGPFAGYSEQSTNSIAIGEQAGRDSQGSFAVSIGYFAGLTKQSTNAIAIGNRSGQILQGEGAVAVGSNAGDSAQGTQAVAIGSSAGAQGQSQEGTAVGYLAGNLEQSFGATAIGSIAGRNRQGSKSVAIGYAAGFADQGDNGIIISSTGSQVDDTSNNHIRITSSQGELKFTTTGGWELIDGGTTYLNINASGNSTFAGTLAAKSLIGLSDPASVEIVNIEATGTTSNSQLIFRNYQDSVLSTAFSVDETGEITASSFAGSGANLTDISYTVTQNDVTQHQLALSITESQISDLQTYLTDAPSDGTQYARQSGAWTAVTGGGGTTYLPVKLDSITTVNGQSTYALTVSGNPYTPSIAIAMLVSVNGTIQEAGTSYTISGTDIVFTSPLQTGDVVDFIVDLAKAVEVDIPTEMNDLTSAVTWAAVPNEFITETAVTQHQLALSITESQISDLQSYLLSETDTLDDVTGRNSVTTNGITVGSVTATDSASANTIDVTSYIDFGTLQITSPAHTEGRVFYNEEYNCLTVYNDISAVPLNVGFQELVRVYNGTGSTITRGTPCRPAGTQGEFQSVAPANATSPSLARVLGVASHDIANGTFGYLAVRGLLSGVDTTGLTAGGPVWLASDGSLTTSAPTYPYFPTQVGGCIVVDGTNGYLYVSPTYLTQSQLRVVNNGHIDGNLTIDGDLTINGTQTITTQNNLAIGDAFIYLNSGDVIGQAGTTFTGSGLDDAYFTGYFEGTTATTFYVRIDGVGTGTGGVDTFEWSLDNFSTTEATGVDITGVEQVLQDNIGVFFNATTGHTSGDTWEGTATPLNVDTGWSTNRNTGATGIGYTHMGVFFDVSDEKFKFFDQYRPEPSGAIDVADSSYNTATIVANFEGSLTGNASTATALATGQNITLTGDVTGTTAVTFNGTGTATIATTLAATYLTDITGENLSDLSDVSATTPTDGQVLTYNNTAGEWQPQDATGGGGGITTGKAIAMAMIFG
jgi:hypothetical protein